MKYLGKLLTDLLKLDSNHRFFLSLWILKFDGWPRKNNTAHLLCYFNLCTSFHSHQWIETGVTCSPETPNSGQNRWFFCPVWPWNLMNDPEKTIGHIFYATSSFVDHFVAISERASFFVPCYLEIWWMTLKNSRAPLLRYFKLFFL